MKRLVGLYGTPQYVRSDNGPELQAQPLLTFFEDRGITPSRMTPGKPWQNGSNESLNGTFRCESLYAEVFRSLAEARVVIEDWRRLYEHQRPHSTLGYQTPATAYWGSASYPSEPEDFSAGAGPEKSTHTFGHKAMIVNRPDSEVEGNHPAWMTTRQNHSKT
ncbi:MAG: integrase core domain-containing protein [Nitrospirales bacterium]|nr:integrase core domain-containing protein [Nitrospirales bacterium]